MWSDVRKGVTQGSNLGLLLLNGFLNDFLMLIEKTEICNFGDGKTLYSCGKEFNIIMTNLKHDMSIVSKRFQVNSEREIQYSSNL